MSVWLAIPSARPDGGTIPLWRERGYRVACWRDPGAPDIECEMTVGRAFGEVYPGYASAVNMLSWAIRKRDPQAEWIVAGGDDVEPDPNHSPEEIARECSEYFGAVPRLGTGVGAPNYETFGVMQPTGDRFAGGSIDRIAGSPWMGAEFCRRMYGGNGPLFDGYSHMFVDEELLCVAEKLGVYWRRPDLIHLHRHFMRESDDLTSRAVRKPIPPHLVKWNSKQHWDESKALFQSRRNGGFPGHEPLPLEACV